jgi:2-octaprenyl-6-methoxyphenol hydroxylase
MSAPARCAVVVAGGGPVGAAAALALHGAGIAVHWLAPAESLTPTADRPIALSRASALLLERLDARAALAGATAIDTIIVSQRGGFGRVVMTAAEAGVPALGGVAAYRDVQAALAAAVHRRSIVCHPAAVSAVDAEDDHRITVTCADGHAVSAQLMVCADGRAAGPFLNGPALERDYGAMALTANLAAAQPHRGRAFERFTVTGPIALLPRGDGYALVWTLPPVEAERLLACPDTEFLVALQSAFGVAAGPFTAVRARSVHPLTLRAARKVTAQRTVAIGNAAQTLHPVAGQGLNLGLRDAWEFAQIAAEHAHDPGAPSVLQSYAARRRVDRWATIAVTDSLARVFAPEAGWARALRGAGFAALGGLPPVRRYLARRMIFGARA